MSYQLDIDSFAKAEILALPAHIRNQARQLIRSLAEVPRPPRAKELRGKPGVYRIWLAGQWRIVYFLDDNDERITILRVRLKDDIDYESIEPPAEA